MAVEFCQMLFLYSEVFIHYYIDTVCYNNFHMLNQTKLSGDKYHLVTVYNPFYILMDLVC